MVWLICRLRPEHKIVPAVAPAFTTVYRDVPARLAVISTDTGLRLCYWPTSSPVRYGWFLRGDRIYTSIYTSHMEGDREFASQRYGPASKQGVVFAAFRGGITRIAAARLLAADARGFRDCFRREFLWRKSTKLFLEVSFLMATPGYKNYALELNQRFKLPALRRAGANLMSQANRPPSAAVGGQRVSSYG